MTTTSYVKIQRDYCEKLRRDKGYIGLWSLVGKYLLKYYGEDNMKLQQAGGNTKQRRIAEKVMEKFGEYTITLFGLPDISAENFMGDETITLIAPIAEKVISLYLDTFVELDYMEWVEKKKKKGKFFYS